MLFNKLSNPYIWHNEKQLLASYVFDESLSLFLCVFSNIDRGNPIRGIQQQSKNSHFTCSDWLVYSSSMLCSTPIGKYQRSMGWWPLVWLLSTHILIVSKTTARYANAKNVSRNDSFDSDDLLVDMAKKDAPRSAKWSATTSAVWRYL